MKKVLALVVAFALCFTAIAGCFAVSATAPVISIETADTSFEISGANYTVKIAQITELTVQNGLAVVDIDNGETKLVEYTPEMDDEDEPEFDWVRSTDEDGNTVIKFLNVIKAGESFTYKVNVDVENAEPGDYAIAATVEAGDYEAGELVDVESASATFTVEAPHVCEFAGEYEKDENGHWQTCTCGATNKAAHVPGEAEEVEGYYVVSCTVCGYEISKEEIIPEHVCTYGELQYKVEGFDFATSSWGKCITYKVCTDETCAKEEVVAELNNVKFGHAPVLESGLIMKYNMPDNSADLLDTYTDVYAHVEKENYAVNKTVSQLGVPTIKDIPYEIDTKKNRLVFVFDEIFSYDMCNNIEVKVYGTNANGDKVLIYYEIASMKTAYLDVAYKAYANNAKMIQLICDIASYGAASQLNFDHNVQNLPTEGFDLSKGTADLALGDFNIADTIVDGKLIQSGAFNFSRAPMLEEVISLNVYFAKTNYVDGAYIKVDFVDYQNNSDSKIYTVDDFDEDNRNRYYINFAELGAIALHDDFTISLCNADGSVIATCKYSYDTYAWQAATTNGFTDETIKLANRLVCYGRSARNYFGYK